MVLNFIRKLAGKDKVIIVFLLLLFIFKVLLRPYQLFDFVSFSKLHPSLLVVFGLACANLFIFFIAAIFTKNKRDEWWERNSAHEYRSELLLNIWAKSLVVSFVIFLVGTLLAVLVFGTAFTVLLFLIVFVVQCFFRLMYKKD